MPGYDLSHITDLETAGTPEILAREIDDLIQGSSKVQAVVHHMLFQTGEYAVVIRGVVATADITASVAEDRFDDLDSIDIADPPGGEG